MYKRQLRTILWGWVGKPLPEADLARLEALSGWLGNPLSPVSQTIRLLLSSTEVEAVSQRIDGLLTTGRFPQPSGRQPAVPWPPL